MSNTLTRPRTVVAILAAGALIAVGVLLLAGLFASDDATKTTGTEDIVVTPTSGGIEQAARQRQEHLLQHGAVVVGGVVAANTKAYDGYKGTGAPGATAGTPVQTGGLTHEGRGDTKGDLSAGSPAAGRFLASPPRTGDTKDDLPESQLGHGAAGYDGAH
jgi:hypothetical protein